MDRKNHLLVTLLGILCCLGFLSVYAATPVPSSPVGYWKTIDDVTGKPKSIIQIWRAEDQTLMGKVVKVFSKEGYDQIKLCTACSGDKRNQPVVGMLILTGLKVKEHQWSSGEILDPDNGKTYSCALRVTDNGKKLNVQEQMILGLF